MFLREEALRHWQDYVGADDVTRMFSRGIGAVRGMIASIIRPSTAPVAEVRDAATDDLLSLARQHAAEASRRTAAAWTQEPAVAAVVAADPTLWTTSNGFDERFRARVVEWIDSIAIDIAETGEGRRKLARRASIGINALGTGVMLATFIHTAGLTGAEVGIAAGNGLPQPEAAWRAVRRGRDGRARRARARPPAGRARPRRSPRSETASNGWFPHPTSSRRSPASCGRPPTTSEHCRSTGVDGLASRVADGGRRFAAEMPPRALRRGRQQPTRHRMSVAEPSDASRHCHRLRATPRPPVSEAVCAPVSLGSTRRSTRRRCSASPRRMPKRSARRPDERLGFPANTYVLGLVGGTGVGKSTHPQRAGRHPREPGVGPAAHDAVARGLDTSNGARRPGAAPRLAPDRSGRRS